MKKLLFVLMLLILVACRNKRQVSADGEKFCGRWMTTDAYGHNHESYWLKRDDTFKNGLFSDAVSANIPGLPKPESWEVSDDRLVFNYTITRYLFHLFGRPIFPIRNSVLRAAYTIKMINDSLMVLASPSTKRYPERITTYKRMKLHGEYIVD